MLKFYLIRHATAEDKYIIGGPTDIDRRLTNKGKKQAKKAGKMLKHLDVKPDLIISSPAARTLETAEIIADQFGYKAKNIQQEPGVYTLRSGYNNNDFLNILSNCSPDEQSIFRVGHNNQHSYFQEFLTGINLGILPKANIVGIEFDTDSWSKLHKGSGKLIFYYAP